MQLLRLLYANAVLPGKDEWPGASVCALHQVKHFRTGLYCLPFAREQLICPGFFALENLKKRNRTNEKHILNLRRLL